MAAPRSSWSMKGTFSSRIHSGSRPSISLKTWLTSPELPPADTSSTSGLAQVLARESRRDKIALREPVDLGNVPNERHTGKALAENLLRCVPDLAQEHALVSGAVKAELDAPDPGEQPDYPQGPRSAIVIRHPDESILSVGHSNHEYDGSCVRPGCRGTRPRNVLHRR